MWIPSLRFVLNPNPEKSVLWLFRLGKEEKSKEEKTFPNFCLAVEEGKRKSVLWLSSPLMKEFDRRKQIGAVSGCRWSRVRKIDATKFEGYSRYSTRIGTVGVSMKDGTLSTYEEPFHRVLVQGRYRYLPLTNYSVKFSQKLIISFYQFDEIMGFCWYDFHHDTHVRCI